MKKILAILALAMMVGCSDNSVAPTTIENDPTENTTEITKIEKFDVYWTTDYKSVDYLRPGYTDSEIHLILNLTAEEVVAELSSDASPYYHWDTFSMPAELDYKQQHIAKGVSPRDYTVYYLIVRAGYIK